MTHYIGYQTHHLPTGRYYIGIHRVKSSNTMDPWYIGSGRAFLAAVDKYGRDQFKRHVVQEFHSLEEADDWETKMVTQEVVDDPRSFNIRKGGRGLGRGEHRASSIEKMKVATARRSADPKWRARNKAHLKRMHASPQWKEKQQQEQERRKKDPVWQQRMKDLGRRNSADPVFRAKMAEKNRRMAQDPAWRARNKERVVEACGSPVEVNNVQYKTFSEASRKLCVARSTIRKWIKTGRNGARRLTKENLQ